MKKSAKKRGERRRRLYLVLIFLIAIAAALTAAAFAYQKMSEPSDEQIIARISKFDLPEGAPWITKIENVEQQTKLYPALFSGTKDGEYALRYETLFAVYDYQEDKIIKWIPIMSINISQ
ncbi:MAG: hypothetical protein WA139_05480 [Candidatus Aenigmatarchaeota archaeon]